MKPFLKGIRVTGEKGEIPSKHAVNQIISAVYAAIGATWHQEMRPRHFTNAAYAMYGYRSRSAKYNKGKKVKLPLVYSGQGRASTSASRIVGTRNGAKVIMPAARVFNFIPKGWNKPLRDELLKVASSEYRQMERQAKSLLKQALSSKAKIRVKLG